MVTVNPLYPQLMPGAGRLSSRQREMWAPGSEEIWLQKHSEELSLNKEEGGGKGNQGQPLKEAAFARGKRMSTGRGGHPQSASGVPDTSVHQGAEHPQPGFHPSLL